MYLAFSCAIIQGFRQTRASKIRILWPACGFFVYFKIQMKSNASGSYDGYVAFSGAIPPKLSTINWHAGHANSNASGSCDGYVTFSCALNSTFLHLRASKIWILYRGCRVFGCNAIRISQQKSWHAGHAIRIHFKIKSSKVRMEADLVTGVSLSRVHKK